MGHLVKSFSSKIFDKLPKSYVYTWDFQENTVTPIPPVISFRQSSIIFKQSASRLPLTSSKRFLAWTSYKDHRWKKESLIIVAGE